jgi:hypothetical protein
MPFEVLVVPSMQLIEVLPISLTSPLALTLKRLVNARVAASASLPKQIGSNARQSNTANSLCKFSLAS